MKIISILFVLFTSTSCLAHKTEQFADLSILNCDKVTASSHLDDCINKKMQVSENKLKSVLSTVLKNVETIYLPDPVLGKALAKKIIETQAVWLNFRKLHCQVKAFEVEEGTQAYITSINSCKIRMNYKRINELEHLFE